MSWWLGSFLSLCWISVLLWLSGYTFPTELGFEAGITFVFTSFVILMTVTCPLWRK